MTKRKRENIIWKRKNEGGPGRAKAFLYLVGVVYR